VAPLLRILLIHGAVSIVINSASQLPEGSDGVGHQCLAVKIVVIASQDIRRVADSDSRSGRAQENEGTYLILSYA
jgi:hypothetical protein